VTIAVASLGVLLSACTDETHRVRAGRLAAKGGVPIPAASMLRAQPAPDCTRIDDRAASSPSSDDPASEKLRARIRQLEFERECYRQYEIQARHRLGQLQLAALRTKREIERRHLASP
jgi:hypothetical protein